jgi:tetratricopeptide (TPR) repeat protein
MPETRKTVNSETEMQHILPAWLELASKTDVSLGLEPSEAYGRAESLLRDLRAARVTTEGWTPDADRVEVLHALVALILRVEATNPRAALADIDLVFNHIAALPWASTDLGGPGGLVSDCALQGWLVARPSAVWPEVAKWTSRVRGSVDAQSRAARALSIPTSERKVRAHELGLLDPRLLLCVCDPSRIEAAPLVLREEAAFFYELVEASGRQISPQDEREYFLGEFALIAGTASRVLLRTADARDWFHRAEGHFNLIQEAEAHRIRVEYQRLALLLETRHVDEVLKLSPALVESFTRLQMAEDALKCRFLEGIAYCERGDFPRAIEIHTAICTEAERLHNPRLLAQAAGNLAACLAHSGETERALAYARKALPLFHQLGNRVNLAKLKWSMGYLFRKQGNRAAAIDAYRGSQADARELGMRGELVDLHLLVADLLLEDGEEAQAEQEIRAALPIIEEEKMVPEGIAALSLLRESLRRRQIDQGALRDLHRHLEDRSR